LPFCHVTLRGQKPLPAAYPKALRTIGDRLRRRRLELGLLQRDVAARLGVNKTTVYNWERKRTAPAPRIRPAVVAFLGHEPSPTCRGEGKPLAIVPRDGGASPS